MATRLKYVCKLSQNRYDQLDEFLTEEARAILHSTHTVDTLSVQYLPQLGFMVVSTKVSHLSFDSITAIT